MRDGDYISYKKTVELLAQAYTDDSFKKVTSAIRYKYSTIVRFENLLARLNIVNSCLEIYNSYIK